MKKDSSIIYMLSIISIIFVRCANPISTPPEIPLETLLSTPDTIIIENQELLLSTFLWRDFQPISPQNGKPLIAIVHIETVDSSEVIHSINSNAIYVIYDNQVWNSFLSQEDLLVDPNRNYRLTKIARDGPKWGPGVFVDVVVRIQFKNKFHLLRASDQYIFRTD